MIPVEIDVMQIVSDLNRGGWKDLQIEARCGFSGGYIAKLRGGTRPNRPYQHVARLFNLWEDESDKRIASWQVQVAATT